MPSRAMLRDKHPITHFLLTVLGPFGYWTGFLEVTMIPRTSDEIFSPSPGQVELRIFTTS